MASSRFDSVPEAVSTTTSHSGAASRSFGSAVRPSIPGIERSRRTSSGRSRAASVTASAPSDACPTTSKPWAPRSDESASRVSGWSSTMRMRCATSTLIGRRRSADKRYVKENRNEYQAWLWGESLLAGLLGASLALYLAYPVLQTSWDLPSLRLVLQTTMALAGLLVALLAALRFSVEG